MSNNVENFETELAQAMQEGQAPINKPRAVPRTLGEQVAQFERVTIGIRETLHRQRVRITHDYDQRLTELKLKFSRDSDELQRLFDADSSALETAFKAEMEQLEQYAKRLG